MASLTTSHDRRRSVRTAGSARESSEATGPLNLPAGTRRFLLGLCIFLAVAEPLCLYFGVKGLAPVIGLAGLACIPLARPTREDWIGLLVLAALMLWATVSLGWSQAPDLRVLNSVKTLSRFMLLHVAALLVLCPALILALARLDATSARKALGWVSYGLLAATPLLVAEGLTGVKVYPMLLAFAHKPLRADHLIANMAQGGYVIAVLAWPLGVALARRGRLGMALALALVGFVPVSMIILRGVAPTMALLLSLPCFFLVLRWRARGAAILAVATAVYMLATPLVMLAIDQFKLYDHFKAGLPPSWGERLRIWSFVAEEVGKAFPRGGGFDASRTFPTIVPLHPHDAPLQIWLELGLPGAVLATVFWLWLWRRIGDCARRDPLYGATAAGAASVYLIFGAVSFGQWQEWWLSAGGFAVALCVLLGKTLVQDDVDLGPAGEAPVR